MGLAFERPQSHQERVAPIKRLELAPKLMSGREGGDLRLEALARVHAEERKPGPERAAKQSRQACAIAEVDDQQRAVRSQAAAARGSTSRQGGIIESA